MNIPKEIHQYDYGKYGALSMDDPKLAKVPEYIVINIPAFKLFYGKRKKRIGI
jgi:hypothetical protein